MSLEFHQHTFKMSFFGFVCRDWLQIDEKTAKLIWHPAIMFENLLNFKLTKSYGNADQNNLWLEGNQSHAMQYGEEFQLTFPCLFNLSKYPFDSHECSVYFGDERYTTDELMIDSVTLIDWNSYIYYSVQDSEPLIPKDVSLAGFGLELEVLPIREKYVGYNINMAGILIRVKRNSLGGLLSGYYYPTASFAVLSIMSFLINPDVVRKSKYLSSSLSIIFYNFILILHYSGSW